MKSLDKAARICGQTRQAFVQTAVLAEVAEVLERRRMKQQRIAYDSVDNLSRQETNALKSGGLGIVETMRQRQHTNVEDNDATPPSTSGQVVVNVSGSSAPNSDIERLAAYVMAGGDFERETRLRTAVSILHASTPTEEERKVLAARLDEAVAVKTKTNDGGVVRATRVAFDKIADLWKGM